MTDADPYALTLQELVAVAREMPRLHFSWGTIYLLHFERPFKHAKHYLGWARDGNLASRVAEHQRGRGASLTKAVVRAGITMELVRTWEGDRHLERDLKRRHGLADFCPRCIEVVRSRARTKMRVRRAR